VREEKDNKDILLGSQQMVPNMMGGTKSCKILGANVITTGGSHSNPPKK